MKILFVAHRIPYPPNKGDKIRSFNEIKYLSGRHDIYLACLADEAGDLDNKGELERICKTVDVVLIDPRKARIKSLFHLLDGQPLSVAYFYSKRLQEIIDYRLSSIDFGAIICFSSPMAEYILNPSTHRLIRGSTRLIMDFVDVDSDKWWQYACYAKWPLSSIYKWESRKLAAYEKKVAESFYYSTFVSPKEAELFCARNSGRTAVTVPNGVDFAYFAASGSSDFYTKPVLLFTGAMDYHANVDGVVWFSKEILPDLIKQFPSLIFYIVGRNPTREIVKLASHHIAITGFVKDMRPFYEMATICIAPLRVARGIQNKILEAMAMSKPVIATSKAFEGLEAVPGRDILIADSKTEFIEKISLLAKDGERRKSIATSARQAVEEKYSWERSVEMLEKILTGS